MPALLSPPLLLSARIAALSLVFGGLAVALGCHDASQTTGPPPPKTPPTREAVVLTIQPRNWPLILRSQGTLVADEVASVGNKVPGSVSEVFVEIGDQVRAGETLVELDAVEFQLQVDQAAAQLAQSRSAIGLKPDQSVASVQPENSPPVRQEQALWDEAKARLSRAQELQTQGVISPAEFDQIVANEHVAEARYASAINATREKIALIGVREVELTQASERLRYTKVVAPFDGVVQQRLVAPGDYVQVGAPIATLVRTDPLRFRGTVPEHHAQSLALGQEVRLQIEGSAKPYVVQVTRISPTLDQASRSLMFEADLTNRDRQLQTGLFAEAELVVNPEAVALVVPSTAVVEFAGAEKVWKVVDGMASEQGVLTGQRRPQGIEILSGLTAGDVILADGSQGTIASIKPLPRSGELSAPEQQFERHTEDSPTPVVEDTSVSTVSG